MRLHLQTQKTDHITIQPNPVVRGTMDTTHHHFSQESSSTATHPKHQHPSTHPFVIWQEWRPRSAGWTNRFQLRSHSGCFNLRMTGGPDVLSKHIVSLFVYGNRNLLWKMLMQGFSFLKIIHRISDCYQNLLGLAAETSKCASEQNTKCSNSTFHCSLTSEWNILSLSLQTVFLNAVNYALQVPFISLS